MKLSKFKFNLPEKLLAERPTENRDESRLMVIHKDTGEIEDVFLEGTVTPVFSGITEFDGKKLFVE